MKVKFSALIIYQTLNGQVRILLAGRRCVLLILDHVFLLECQWYLHKGGRDDLRALSGVWTRLYRRSTGRQGGVCADEGVRGLGGLPSSSLSIQSLNRLVDGKIVEIAFSGGDGTYRFL